MRKRGIHHIELTVANYNSAISFYDQLFGWLGFKSFWTLDIEYRSTYYVAGWLPHFPHTYVGIQPAKEEREATEKGKRYSPGLNHLALAARSKKEIRRFHRDFLIPRGIEVIDPPAAYPHYAPGYFAVFFRDPPLGATWELAFMPLIPSPKDLLDTRRAWKRVQKEQRERNPDADPLRLRDSLRKLPTQSQLSTKTSGNRMKSND